MQKIQLEEITTADLGIYYKMFAINESETEQIQVWDKQPVASFCDRNSSGKPYEALCLWVIVEDLENINPLINRLCELDPLSDQRICRNLMDKI